MAVQLVFVVLQRHAAGDTLVGETTWMLERDAEVAILSVETPGLAAATRRLPILHTLFAGLPVHDSEIPDLGAYVEPDCVAPDDRQESQRDPATLVASAQLRSFRAAFQR